MLRAIVFDMDGVLCELRDAARLDYLSRLCGKAPEAIKSEVWDSGFEDRSDSGELSADQYLEGFGARIG